MNTIPINIVEQAQLCKSKSDFRNNYNYSFLLAKENKWLDTLFPPVVKSISEPKSVLTKEHCIEIAKQFNSKKELITANPAVYNKIYKLHWCDDAFSHMTHASQKWTLELCQIEASKYSTKKEFKQYNLPAYIAAYKYKWVDTICQHMQPLRIKHKK